MSLSPVLVGPSPVGRVCASESDDFQFHMVPFHFSFSSFLDTGADGCLDVEKARQIVRYARVATAAGVADFTKQLPLLRGSGWGCHFLVSMKICQRDTLSSLRTPFSNHGSFFSFSRTSFSSPAMTINRAPCGISFSLIKGPPIKIKPSSTS